MIGAFPVWLWVTVISAVLIVAFVPLAGWLANRPEGACKTPRPSRQGSRRGARAGDRLREHWRSLPATIRNPFRREPTPEELEAIAQWKAIAADLSAEQARNRQYPIVTSSPAPPDTHYSAAATERALAADIHGTLACGAIHWGIVTDNPVLVTCPPCKAVVTSSPATGTHLAGDAPGPVRATPQGAEGSRVPFAAAAAGPGAPWLPAPIPHQGPWQGHPELQVHHDEFAPTQVWQPEPRDGRAVRPAGALMSPLLPAVVVLRAMILTVEPAATRPWEHDTSWNTITAIDADIAAKRAAS